MKGFNELNEFKNLKFHSVIPQDILQAVELLGKIGYEAEDGFSADDAAKYNGLCAWDYGEITEGWLDDDNFEQATLEELKEMVGETNRCDNTLSNNFTIAWAQVFGEKFIDSVYKAVKQNKDNTKKKDKFTLNRLLGCEVLFGDTLYHVNYIYYAGAVGHLVLETDTRRVYVSDFNHLTFFTEDEDELTFDEYVQLYYPKG